MNTSRRTRTKSVDENATLASTRHILGESPLLKQLEQKLRKRELITKLVALRAAKGLAQNDIAIKMQCSQSRISKLEASDDDDIRLGDLREYLNAIDLNIHGVISPKSWSAVSQIKFHAFQIRDCLAMLCEVAKDDEEIRCGVQEFHVEALVNLTQFIVESSQNLPASLLVNAPSVVDADEEESQNGLAHID